MAIDWQKEAQAAYGAPGSDAENDVFADESAVDQPLTLQAILRAKVARGAYVAEIIPIPQKKSAGASIFGEETDTEGVNRYMFSDGTYFDVGANTSRPIGGTALNGLKVPTEKTASPHYYDDPQTGAKMVYDPNTKTSDVLSQGPAPAQSEPKLVGRTWWKYEPNSGQPINVGEIPLTAAEKAAQDLDLAYKRGQIANLGAANVLAQDKFAWEQAKEIENRRHEIEKQRQADEAAMERQRLSEQANLFDTVTKNWRELLPRRVPQGMEYWPGAEPEGPLSVLYKQAGAQYNPVAGRVVPTSYNDEDMWKKALGMVGGKQNG